MWPNIIWFLTSACQKQLGFNFVNKTFSVTRSSNSKERFTKMTFKSHFGVVCRTVQSRLLPWWSTKCSMPLEKKNWSMLNQPQKILESSWNILCWGTLPSLCWTWHTLFEPTKTGIAMEMQFVQLCATWLYWYPLWGTNNLTSELYPKTTKRCSIGWPETWVAWQTLCQIYDKPDWTKPNYWS